MMGLVEGGNCNGIAYRIERKKARTELDLLFRREMALFSYKPVWTEATRVDTNDSFTTLTFVADTSNSRFVDDLSQAEITETLATAKGPLGRNCDYLFQLSEKLRELEFDESELDNLAHEVREYQSRHHS